jgi:hypothetical protein
MKIIRYVFGWGGYNASHQIQKLGSQKVGQAGGIGLKQGRFIDCQRDHS